MIAVPLLSIVARCINAGSRSCAYAVRACVGRSGVIGRAKVDRIARLFGNRFAEHQVVSKRVGDHQFAEAPFLIDDAGPRVLVLLGG